MFSSQSGTVAENSATWRFSGRRPISRSISGPKPSSSMRSPSSRTKKWMSPRRRSPWSIRSMIRPGVPITICAPASRAWRCGPYEVPPWISTLSMPVSRAAISATERICWASSRVGARISACGRRRPGSIDSMTGSRKAIVLPEPVGAWASRSRPSSRGGIASSWIGAGLMMSSSARFSMMSDCTPRAPKSLSKLFLLSRGCPVPAKARNVYSSPGARMWRPGGSWALA